MVNRKKICPLNCEYEEKTFSPLLTKLLSKLKISCRYKENECKEILDYEALEKHEANCGYQIQQCRGCNIDIIRKDIEKHELSCGRVKIECKICHSTYERQTEHGLAQCVFKRFDDMQNEMKTLKETIIRLQTTIEDKKSDSQVPSRSVLHGYNGATYTSNVGVSDHLKFDSVSFSNGTGITLDSSSAYNTSLNTASIGRITLAAGRIYKLTGSINNVTANAGSYNATRWYNSDTDTALGLVSGAAAPNSTTNRSPSAGTVAYISTSTTTRVELRITYNAFASINSHVDAIGPAWFTAETI